MILHPTFSVSIHKGILVIVVQTLAFQSHFNNHSSNLDQEGSVNMDEPSWDVCKELAEADIAVYMSADAQPIADDRFVLPP